MTKKVRRDDTKDACDSRTGSSNQVREETRSSSATTGEIVERGPHEELLAIGGPNYAGARQPGTPTWSWRSLSHNKDRSTSRFAPNGPCFRTQGHGRPSSRAGQKTLRHPKKKKKIKVVPEARELVEVHRHHHGRTPVDQHVVACHVRVMTCSAASHCGSSARPGVRHALVGFAASNTLVSTHHQVRGDAQVSDPRRP